MGGKTVSSHLALCTSELCLREHVEMHIHTHKERGRESNVPYYNEANMRTLLILLITPFTFIGVRINAECLLNELVSIYDL